MNTIDMIGGFVKECIEPKIFEQYIYKNIKNIEHELPADIFSEIISIDYNNKYDIPHIKKILSNYYGDQLEKYNDAFFEIEVEKDEDLRKAIGYKEPDENISFDCSEISTSAQLQNKIKETFNLSDYYGMNWDAFNDIVDISVFKEVELKSFYEMYNIIPDDSLTFLEILIKQSGHSKHKCRITIK